MPVLLSASTATSSVEISGGQLYEEAGLQSCQSVSTEVCLPHKQYFEFPSHQTTLCSPQCPFQLFKNFSLSLQYFSFPCCLLYSSIPYNYVYSSPHKVAGSWCHSLNFPSGSTLISICDQLPKYCPHNGVCCLHIILQYADLCQEPIAILYQKTEKRIIFQTFWPECSCFSSELSLLNQMKAFHLLHGFSVSLVLEIQVEIKLNWATKSWMNFFRSAPPRLGKADVFSF